MDTQPMAKPIEFVFTDSRKAAMVNELIDSMGIVSYAAQRVGISRQTHYDWMKTDENYRTAATLANESALDMAESRLYNLIDKNDFRAIAFVLRTRGRSRGYSQFKENIDQVKKGFTIIVKDAETAKILNEHMNGK